MPERICQLGFDLCNPQTTVSYDVTPPGFSGIKFPAQSNRPKLGRFVKEAKARASITSPAEAADYLLKNIYTPFEEFDQEEMHLLLLNRKNQVMFEVLLYRGTIDTAFIRIPELFKEALKVNAPALILSHCHPSGAPDPSPEDVAVTAKAVEASHLLEVEILDHIILGSDNRWVSLKERGLGF